MFILCNGVLYSNALATGSDLRTFVVSSTFTRTVLGLALQSASYLTRRLAKDLNGVGVGLSLECCRRAGRESAESWPLFRAIEASLHLIGCMGTSAPNLPYKETRVNAALFWQLFGDFCFDCSANAHVARVNPQTAEFDDVA